MKFTVHKIGNHFFVETRGYVVALSARVSEEELIENFKENYEQVKARAHSEEQAFEYFVAVSGMKKREDWVNYTYDGHCMRLSQDDGYKATLPICYSDGSFQQLTIRYWREYEDEKLYMVLDDFGSWRGTIRRYNEEPKAFYERFIGEVCFHNGILEENFQQKLFPFSSNNVKKAFDFSPGLAVINPVQAMLGLS